MLYGDTHEDKRMEIGNILIYALAKFLCDYAEENISLLLLLLNKDVTQLAWILLFSFFENQFVSSLLRVVYSQTSQLNRLQSVN
jgi:hypothetical protein